MRAGKFRQIVVIEFYESDRQGLDQVRTYGVFAVRHATIEKVLGGKEFEKAKAYSAERNYKVCLRFVEGLDTKMRLNFQGRTFEITAVLDVEERHEEMEVYCTELLGEKKRFYEFAVGGVKTLGTAA